jgi:hypothetical protein
MEADEGRCEIKNLITIFVMLSLFSMCGCNKPEEHKRTYTPVVAEEYKGTYAPVVEYPSPSTLPWRETH